MWNDLWHLASKAGRLLFAAPLRLNKVERTRTKKKEEKGPRKRHCNHGAASSALQINYFHNYLLALQRDKTAKWGGKTHSVRWQSDSRPSHQAVETCIFKTRTAVSVVEKQLASHFSGPTLGVKSVWRTLLIYVFTSHYRIRVSANKAALWNTWQTKQCRDRHPYSLRTSKWGKNCWASELIPNHTNVSFYRKENVVLLYQR